ncbi:MAG: TonB family protein [Sphingosinicella sp.]|nr:TonB family protein [Sphingosinicella sp.]
MTRTAFLFALLLGTAAPSIAGPPNDAAIRDASNEAVIESQYPARALAAGEQGAVGFKVTLDREGYASACEVTQSSGYKLLDAETCQLILNRATFKGIKDENGRKISSVASGVVNWRLPANASGTPAPAMTIASNAAPEKKICRRRLKTGSLADFERICATRADWESMAQRTREEWGELQGSKGSTHGQ